MSTSATIGIDLGTTNSCVAVMEGGKPRIIENKSGQRTTRSFIAFGDEDSLMVGTAAYNQAATNPEPNILCDQTFYGTLV